MRRDHRTAHGIDLFEPARLADTVARMGSTIALSRRSTGMTWRTAAPLFSAGCIKKIREQSPSCKVEVLIPDFAGSWTALEKVLDAGPDVLNHNIESTRRIFPMVRPKGDYRLSLDLLAKSKELAPNVVTKSGIIVGMGEAAGEVVEDDGRSARGRL